MTSSSERLQLMHVSRQLLRAEIQDLEVRYNLDPISPLVEQTTEEEGYYLQFSAATRRQAQEMSQYYRVFYCLENSIRDLVESQMEATHGENWWDHHVPDNIKAGVRGNKQREQDNGVTLRSAHPIDYTTFGELSEIIKNNWDIFGATFNSKRGVEKVLSGLNVLRGPIAHCAMLAEDEVTRLHISVRDFYRLME